MKTLVTQSSMPPMEEYIDEIKELWDSKWLTNMGKKHKEFQRQLVKMLEVDNVELLTNGHMALELSMQALKLKGEVITTPFTFASTTHAIVRNGLTPVFCDIKDSDYTIDVEKIEELITQKTTAIVPVHVYGNICDIENIERIAKKYSLKVIYDAAHAFGIKYNGRGIGDYGDASCFSFHATKVFHSIEGGAVCYKDESFGKDLFNLKNFGIRGPESVVAVGANAKMNEFCAAMGLCNLRHFDGEVKKRKAVCERYIERLENQKGLKVNYQQHNATANYAYFPLVVQKNDFGNDRDFVCTTLAKRDIYARKYFYPLTNSYECYADKFDVSLTPIAQQISKSVITLPMYADLPLEKVDEICDIILSCRA